MTELLKTPLYDIYEKYGGKVVDFGGWALPVRFSNDKEEYFAVREKAGLFDVSHMAEFMVTGSGAKDFIQYIITNDISKLAVGKIVYTTMCYEDGGVVDDFLVYNKGNDEYLLVLNASNEEKNLDWLNSHVDKFDNVKIENVSSEIALLAIQGPLAQEIVQTLTDVDLNEISFFGFKDNVAIAGRNVLISRTGYTGEDGFEIYLANEDAVPMWEALLEAGKDKGLLPCGLGSRDILRFEAGLPLYGQEINKDISPVEGGIGFAVRHKKEADFIGKDVLVDQKENGAPRKLVGIEMVGKGIPRNGYEIFVGDKQIGFVTTGTQLPGSKRNVGGAILDAGYWDLDTEVEVQIRQKRVPAKVVKFPFYRREK